MMGHFCQAEVDFVNTIRIGFDDPGKGVQGRDVEEVARTERERTLSCCNQASCESHEQLAAKFGKQ